MLDTTAPGNTPTGAMIVAGGLHFQADIQSGPAPRACSRCRVPGSGTTATPPIEDRFHTHAGDSVAIMCVAGRRGRREDPGLILISSDALPVVDRCIPEVAELFDAGIVHQQAYRPTSWYTRSAMVCTATASHRRRCRVEPPAAHSSSREGGNRSGVNVDLCHTTVIPSRAAWRAVGTDPGACPGDDRYTTAEGFLRVHAGCEWLPRSWRRVRRTGSSPRRRVRRHRGEHRRHLGAGC